MFFLRNRATLPIDENNSNEPSFESSENENPNFFLRKSFLNTEPFSGPEHLYENEAWAPEQAQIRLFNRKRGIAEEQISSPSGPQ